MLHGKSSSAERCAAALSLAHLDAFDTADVAATLPFAHATDTQTQHCAFRTLGRAYRVLTAEIRRELTTLLAAKPTCALAEALDPLGLSPEILRLIRPAEQKPSVLRLDDCYLRMALKHPEVIQPDRVRVGGKSFGTVR